MDDEDLAGLIEQAKAGDEFALRDLLSRCEEDVRMVVRARLPRLLRSQFDSMDFVQAVWQSVFTGPDRDLRRFENVRHLRGFLAGVAQNKVFEEHRRRTRTQKYDLAREEPLFVRRGNRDVLRELPTPEPSPSQNAQAGDRLDQMIAGRSPLEAEVVHLRRQGLTFEEIAARTGLPERSIRRIIDAIRRRMEARRWQ